MLNKIKSNSKKVKRGFSLVKPKTCDCPKGARKEFGKTAFTLIELIVVMAVIGILVLIAMGIFKTHVDKSRTTRIQHDIKALEQASDVYRIGKDKYPVLDVGYSLEDLISPTSRIYNKSGEVKELGLPGELFELDWDKLSPAIKEPSDGDNFVWGKDSEEIYYIGDPIEGEKIVEGEEDVPATEYTAADCFDFEKSTGTIMWYDSWTCGVNVSVPKSISDVSVQHIHKYAFNMEDIDTIILPDTITEIRDETFYTNSLTSVVIPDSVKRIGDWAFSDNKIKNLIIPEGVESIGISAFSYNGIESVELPQSLKHVYAGAFAGNEIRSVLLPDNLETIGNMAFEENYISEIVIPGGIRSLGVHSFSRNLLTSAVLSEGIENIEDLAFSENHLTEITIPQSVKLLYYGAFSDNPITDIEILGTPTAYLGQPFSYSIALSGPGHYKLISNKYVKQ